MTTIGVSFLFVGFVRKQHWLGAEMGLSKIPGSGLGPDGNAMMILIFAAATIAFSLYLNRSWMGFAFRAVADDEQAARTIAIPASTYKLVAFAIGTRHRRTCRRSLHLLHAIHRAGFLRLHPVGDVDGDGGDRRHRLDLGRGGRCDHPDAAAGGVPLHQ